MNPASILTARTTRFARIASACVLAGLPALLALDHGGVLPWTMWVASIVAIGLVVVGSLIFIANQWFVSRDPQARHSVQGLLLAFILMTVSGFGLLQTASLPQGLLNWISPGSVSAHTHWLAPFQQHRPPPAAPPTIAISSTSPVSVAPWLTFHGAAWFAVLSAFTVVATTVFGHRGTVPILLCGFAIMVVLHSVSGIYMQLQSDASTEIADQGKPFGFFINRNNAAVILNLGIGCGLGLLIWRVSALSGVANRSLLQMLNSLREVGFDPMAWCGLAAVMIGFLGLLACGSRGGAIGGGLGLLFSMHAFASLSRTRILWVLVVAAAFTAALMASSFWLPSTTIDRLADDGTTGLVESVAVDGRWLHAQDGLRTFTQHWSMGAGMGTYGYAYLPYQESSPGFWFQHADNMWLEWLVETGIIGTLLLFLTLGLIIRALIRLRRSVTPLDHGLSVAGWFAIISLGFSQSFDFGVTLSAASVATVTLAAAILARSDQQPKQKSRSRRKSRSGHSAHSPGRRSDSNHSDGNHRDMRHGEMPNSTSRSFNHSVGHSIAGRSAGKILDYFHIASQPLRRIERLLSHRKALGMFLGLAATLAFLGQTTLLAHATSDTLVRRSQVVRIQPDSQLSLSVLNALQLSLESHCDTYPSDFVARSESSQLLKRGIRIRLINQAISPDESEIAANFSISRLRTIWYRGETFDDSTSDSPNTGGQNDQGRNRGDRKANQEPGFSQIDPASLESDVVMQIAKLARKQQIIAIANCPLHPELRIEAVQLDFAGGSRVQSSEVLSQAAILRRQNATSLRFIAKLAAQSNDWPLAGSVWRRSIRVDVMHAQETLVQAERLISNSIENEQRQPPISITDIVPPIPAAMLLAARRELVKLSPDQRFLKEAGKSISTNMPHGTEDQAAALATLGDIEAETGSQPNAAENYIRSLKLAPKNEQVQVKLIKSLQATGDHTRAQQQARHWSKISPGNQPLKKLLE